MSRILCLDLATNSGYAYNLDNNEIMSGSLNFEKSLKPKDRIRGAKLALAESQLNNLIYHCKPHKIIYEAPFMRGAGSRLLWGLTSIVEMLAYKYRIEVDEISAKRVRKILLNNGNASKEDVMNYLTSQNIKFSDNDEADAIAILLSLKS